MTHPRPSPSLWLFAAGLVLALTTLSTSTAAQTKTATFDLKGIIIGSQEMTGSFDWTYKVGEFENGTGTFTKLFIPIWGNRTSPGYKVTLDTSSLEISMIGNFHNLGLDIGIKFLGKFSATGATLINPAKSKYDINGRKGLITSGRIVPTCPPPTNYGSGSAGSGQFVPEQTSTGGLPKLGNSNFQLETSKLLGGANCFLLIGPTPANQALFGVTLLVDTTNSIVVSQSASGPSGVAGKGTVLFPLAVPNQAQLIGAELNVQCLALDTGAPQGIASASNGLHITVCQ